MINSALVSAQKRPRLYWTNINSVEDKRKFFCVNVRKTMLKQPKDKEILLKDILEIGVCNQDKSYCLDYNYWKGTNVEQYIKKKIRQIAFMECRTTKAKKIRKEFMLKYGRDFSPRREKQLVARSDGKMNCLTKTFSLKECTLIDEKLYYRKLTPIECERLQTIPDDYTSLDGEILNTQRYKLIGNAFTVDVVAHILSYIRGKI